jgi:hypothetical protein
MAVAYWQAPNGAMSLPCNVGIGISGHIQESSDEPIARQIDDDATCYNDG